MDALRDLARRMFKGPSDVVGLELSAGSVPCVRLRRVKDAIHLVGADVLAVDHETSDGADAGVPAVTVPLPLRAPYAALTVPSSKAPVKLINIPGRFTEKDEESLPANLGVADDHTHRLGYHILSEGRGKGETRILAVAMPEADAQAALSRFAHGKPAPCSLEVSGIASLSGFIYALGGVFERKTVGVMDGSDNCTTFAIFHQGTLVLVRRFDFGCDTVIANVADKLGIDIKTAQGFMDDSSFDISTILRNSLEPFCKQILISKEFVERRENCRLAEILLSGSMSAVRGADDAVSHFLNVDTRKWNPFSGLVMPEQALPQSVTGNEARFAAALGAAMAVLMTESA